MGIEAIVILVLAMAVLGLGLGFLRSVIGQGQKSVIKAIDNAELQNPASSDNPITVDSRVTGKPGESVVVIISAYGGTAGIQNAPVTVTCHSGLMLNADGSDTLTMTQSIAANSAAGFQAVIKIPSGAQPGLYPCSVSVGADLSKQTIVQVIQ
jgi:uncharacterized membrane protein